MISEILIIFILILINGLFSMSEISIVSSRKARLELKAKKGNKGARAALDLSNTPNRFLSTVQFGITLVGILTGIYSGATITEKMADWFVHIGQQKASFSFLISYGHSISVGIVVVIITFVTLVFGELIPKRIGMSKPEAIAQVMAPIMLILSKITAPFIWLLSATTEIFIRLFNIKADESKITEEEIKAIIDEGATAGTIEEIEQDIVERVFHLGDKRVGALMTHRAEIIWLDANDPLTSNLEKIQTHRHAVYPVSLDELDKIVGIVHVKDILARQLKGEPLEFQAMAGAVNFFPENMSAYLALEKFKDTRIHQALVIDEYGTIVGIVTINDLFDALVGDISQEEGDSISYEKVEREDGSYLFDGQYPWDDFLKEFDLEEDDTHIRGGFHTLSGFILHQLKELPVTGEIIKWNHFSFEVVDMDGMRIDKILVKQIMVNG